MRLVQVAKALAMTGQQLRHELELVNFGVKPTDREIPDSLAQGIIRFIARKHGISVDMEALGLEGEKDEGVREEAKPAAAAVEVPPETASDGSASGVNVLRKLTLEDVSKEAIQKQEQSERAKQTPAKRSRHAQAEDRKPKERTTDVQEQIKKKEGVVPLPAAITVKEFAEKTGIQIPLVIQTLMKNGVLATITQTIDFDTASIVAQELGVTVQKIQESASAETLLSRDLDELIKDEPENLEKRPPVVVVMGHVDHGKTSILDAIRQTDVAGGESGGITQHIGAYQVEHVVRGTDDRHRITFLDTPGHEAFTAMRARGAHITDIAIIVVAADEGVKPTTVEAIHHAKEAGVPIIVAINKIDRPGSDPERVKGEIAAQGLQPEEWGGTVPFVLCSAKTKQGIEDLLDSLVLLAEIQAFKANPRRPGIATVIESHLDSALGPLGSVVVNTGTLKIGDVFVCGATMGKIRTMTDAHGKRVTEIGPSGAVRLSGFHGMIGVGDILQVVPSEKQARLLIEEVQEQRTRKQTSRFVDLVSRLSEGKITQLNVVLKADAQGSLEALQEALGKLATTEVGVKVIHGALGGVTKSDIMMAAASDGIVIAFRVPVSAQVQSTADHEGVNVRSYEVIYQLLDDVEGLLKGLVEPVDIEKILGHLEVKAVFLTKKSEQIIGGKVLDGVVKRLTVRLKRGEELKGTGRILSLRKVDQDIKEAKEGTECGMRIETTVPVEVGDIIEVYLRELKKKEGV